MQIHDVDPEVDRFDAQDFSSVLFLFARFCARIEIVRQESLFVA